MMLLHSCILSVNACKSPISLSGIAQNPRVLSTHYWFWAAFPPAAICTHFFNSCLHLCFSQDQFRSHCPPIARKNTGNQYLYSFCHHERCTGHVHPAQSHFHPALSSQHSTMLYRAHWCFHNTQSFLNSIFPLLEHPPHVPDPL